jgi:hypothetical protein
MKSPELQSVAVGSEATRKDPNEKTPSSSDGVYHFD